MDLSKITLCKDNLISEAVKSLNSSGVGIVLVNDTNDVFIGTITDGDIRRGILAGFDLSASISKIVRKNPLVVNKEISYEEAVSIMQSNNLRHLPVLKNGILIDLHLLNRKSSNVREEIFFIMAGGFGKRLYPHTKDTPKPMLFVAGKPILEHIILRAKKEGFINFCIAVHYLSNVVKDYFGNGSKLNINIEYIDENVPLGTAGALSLFKPKNKLPIVITNGDVITDISYSNVLNYHYYHSAFATMSVTTHYLQNPFGVVLLEDITIKGFEEKPVFESFINAGIYVLSNGFKELMVHNSPIDMPDLIMNLKEYGKKVIACPAYEEWSDIGNPADLTELRSQHE